MTNIPIDRLRTLKRRRDEIWQGGLMRLPMWIGKDDATAKRAGAAVWLSVLADKISHGEPQLWGTLTPEDALDQFMAFVQDDHFGGYLPGQVQVKDEALAEFLREPLAMMDVKVVLKESLRYMDQAMAEMTNQRSHQPPTVSLLEAQGMTVQRVAAFAQAANVFYEAAPWQLLDDMDLIHIKAPQIDPDMAYVGIMGAGGKSYGLSFFNSIEQYQLMMQGGDLPRIFQHAQRGLWGMTFDPAKKTPYQDLDLWDEYNLVTSGESMFPCLICSQPRGKNKRPSPQILTLVEGLMRVMAEVDNQTLEQLAWTTQVQTFEGPLAFELELVLDDVSGSQKQECFEQSPSSLPDPRLVEREMQKFGQLLSEHPDENPQQLLEKFHQGDAPSPRATQAISPMQQAQELCYEAIEQKGSRGVSLAREALKVCQDCTDAHVILAENANDVQQARQHYLQGIDAAKRVLGEDYFEQMAGHFWGIMETRPYMRALLGLGQCAMTLNNHDQAIEHYREMLRLNPNDNQGVRDLLLAALLEQEKYEEASKLTRQYKWDDLTLFSYARALLSYRKKGDTPAARKLRKKAIQANPYVPDFLADDAQMPMDTCGMYTVGSEDEAAFCVELLFEAWDQIPGAIEWINQDANTQSPTTH